jgi:hypothetical protein
MTHGRRSDAALINLESEHDAPKKHVGIDGMCDHQPHQKIVTTVALNFAISTTITNTNITATTTAIITTISISIAATAITTTIIIIIIIITPTTTTITTTSKAATGTAIGDKCIECGKGIGRELDNLGEEVARRLQAKLRLTRGRQAHLFSTRRFRVQVGMGKNLLQEVG